MKLVTAIIQPDSLDDVQLALIRYGVHGMTVSEVSGYARQRGHREVYRGEAITVDFIVKVKLEILCRDAEAPAVLAVIAEAARTGRVGDGKVWVTDVGAVVRVRTGERDDDAI